MKYKRTFTIDRAKWRAGAEGSDAIGLGGTLMLNEQGYMCCLGHIALQCGFTQKQLLGAALPRTVVDRARVEPSGFLTRKCATTGDPADTGLTVDAANINDTANLGRKEREHQLTALFAEHGYRLRFVGRAQKRC